MQLFNEAIEQPASGRNSKLSAASSNLTEIPDLSGSTTEDRHTKDRDSVKTLIENLPSAFVLLDSNLRVLLASSAIRNIGQWRKIKSPNRYCSKIICGVNPCEICRTKMALQTGHAQSFTFAVKDGIASGERYFEHQAIPVAGQNGDRQVLVVLTDITDKVSTLNRLLRAEKLSVIGEMAAVLSHGFRNSLTSLKMILQLHLESLNPDNSEVESMKVALESVSNMEGVVGELLSFANNRRLIKQEQDLNLLIREAVELSRRKLQSENIRLNLDLEPTLALAQLDDPQIKEAIINLILNACEAMMGGGDIFIRTRNAFIDSGSREREPSEDADALSEAFRSRTASISGGMKVPAVSVEISDEGEGIAPENMKRIFDPFFTTKINGTGLGLAIVKRTVEDHDGSIQVESGTWGSKFTLTIPLCGQERWNREIHG